MCTERAARGFTLIELVVFMVIVSVGLAGILAVMNVASRGSADPLEPKQALMVAEALLEELQRAPLTYCDPDDANAATANSSADCASAALREDAGTLGPEAGDARPYDNVSDYNALALVGISDVAGNAVAPLSGYNAQVAVSTAALGTLPAGEALRIRVTVTPPSGRQLVLEGFRTRHAPRSLP